MISKIRKRYVGSAVMAAGLAFVLIFAGGRSDRSFQKTGAPGAAFGAYISEAVESRAGKLFAPVLTYQEKGSVLVRLSMIPMGEIMPLYAFGWSEGASGKNLGTEQGVPETPDTQQSSIGMITLGESDDAGKIALSEGGDLQALMRSENEAAGMTGNPAGTEGKTNTDLKLTGTDFVPHTTKPAQVDLNALADYETLVETFYTIDKSTMIGSDQLNVAKLSSVDMSISGNSQNSGNPKDSGNLLDSLGPQILIYHTHSQEAFADSVPGDPSTTIVGVGEYLTQLLTEDYGYQVLHHTGEYDVPSRDDAYSVALPEIEKLLKENPQIQVVIDLHRDAMDENTRLVTEIDGRPTARFMFFNGLSRTRKTGNISYLYNEYLDDNLAFSFQLQKAAMEYYPGLTRKIYLKAYRYNMHLRPRNLLIELGAQNNTLEEAMNACLPLAHILDMVLSGQR